MKVYMNTGGVAQTNCFLVGDEASKQAVLFDAPDNTAAPLLDECQKQGWDLIGLWLTHGHFDHIADHAIVTQRFPNARILIHALDEPKLQSPERQGFFLPFTIPPRSADAHVEEGQVLKIGSLEFHVLHTPGHAPGHVMYHCPAQKLLIGGDLIIANSIGRTDLPDSRHADLEKSIRRIMQLPPDTKLMPGHGDPTTLDEQRHVNPYVDEILRG